MGKKRKKKLKFRFGFFFIFVVFFGITTVLSYNLFCNISDINKMKNEKDELEDKLVKLEDEKKILESDISKLEDPDYIAKYVREKYYYSKDGEVILKIDD